MCILRGADEVFLSSSAGIPQKNRSAAVVDGPVTYTSFNRSNTAMSNPNGLLGQKVCHYLGQGRTLSDISLRVAY